MHGWLPPFLTNAWMSPIFNIWLIIAIAAGVAIVLLSTILFCSIKREKLNIKGKIKKAKKMWEQMAEGTSTSSASLIARVDNKTIQLFRLESKIEMTNNFSEANKLGEGGFGPVYKGMLPCGQEVAIKRLARNSGQGLAEFRNEVLLIAKLQHTNLVNLLGSCIQGQETILIYEYMPNKSLDHFLFDPSRQETLQWTTRMRIIEGIAQGLLYLHKYSRLKVIHRDLKANNVLLDLKMNPKISDFGMARIFETQQSETRTKKIVGTHGYMSPEYIINGVLSLKTDVFSFGVLLIEIISGKKNRDNYDADRPLNLIGLAWDLWVKGRAMELVDSTIDDHSGNQSELLKYINVGLLCVQDRPNGRPSMMQVVSMLTNESFQLPTPKQPAFFIEVGDETPLLRRCSINDLTISVMEAR